jgi:hypothetical protein
MSATSEPEGHSHFNAEISRLADAARTDSLHNEGGSRRTQRRRLSRLLRAGAVLVLVELVSLAVLFSMRMQERASIGTPVNSMLGRTDCDAVSYRTYWRIAAYVHDKGRPPKALSDLVGSYLAELPADPKTGKPLQYSTNGQHFDLKCPS